jgi:uncharacterized protein (DUF302 family)
MEETMGINISSVLVGVIIGLVIMGLAVWFLMPILMLNKHRSKRNYGETLSTLSEGLQQKQDWHLLKITDYQESTAAFGSLERICSLSVCNPRYASKILTDDANRGVTAFMPLAVGIYENKKREVYVSQLNVKLLGLMFGGTISRVMKMAGTDLNEVVASVTTN